MNDAMNCPRCGERMIVITTDSGGAFVCQPCQNAELRAKLEDRIRDAVLDAAKANGQQQRKG